MKQNTVRKCSFLLLYVLFSINCFALDIPSLAGDPLHDRIGLLQHDQAEQVRAVLFEIDERKNFQAAVLIIRTLDGLDIETYAREVFEAWRLGDAQKNNGILILIALEDRSMRIEVGYGLESIVTDTRAGIIIRNLMAPPFKEEKYSDGILAALGAIVDLVEEDGEVFAQLEEKDNSGELGIGAMIFIICFILLVTRLTRLGGGSSGGRSYSGSRSYSGGGGRGFSGGGGRSGGGGASGGW